MVRWDGFGALDQKVYEELIIPEEVEIDKHKYIDGEFIVNEDYKPVVDINRKILELESLLADLAEIVLLGGI